MLYADGTRLRAKFHLCTVPTQTPYLQILTTPPMPTLIQCRGVARYTLELPVVGEVAPFSSLEQSLQLTPTGVRHNPQLTGNEWFVRPPGTTVPDGLIFCP